MPAIKVCECNYQDRDWDLYDELHKCCMFERMEVIVHYPNELYEEAKREGWC